MKPTRKGIFYDLRDSPYTFQVENLIYHFSSRYYLEGFKTRRDEFHQEIAASLSRRFGILISHPLLADLVLYAKIEKRGFLIELVTAEGVTHLCRKENLKLSGGRLTNSNSTEASPTITEN